jgi:hypothetical protein
MMHNYAEYFKILTVLDIYNVTLKFIEFVKSPNNYIKSPFKDSIRLVNDINQSAEYYLSTILNKLIAQGNFEDVANMEWPMLTVIKDIFIDDHIKHHSKQYDNIVDVYNFNNDTPYSISALKHFSPMVKDLKAGGDDMPFYINSRKAYEAKTLQNYQVVNIIQTRQLQKNL